MSSSARGGTIGRSSGRPWNLLTDRYWADIMYGQSTVIFMCAGLAFFTLLRVISLVQHRSVGPIGVDRADSTGNDGVRPTTFTTLIPRGYGSGLPFATCRAGSTA